MKCASLIVPLSAAVWMCVMVGGCSTPPSVPLLVNVAGKVIQQEQQHLADDSQRLSGWYDQQRAALTAGFNDDLAARGELDAEWVARGANVYVTAREMLLRHELESQQRIETRRENLRLAGEALGRATIVMQQQDQLLWSATRLRQWINEQLEFPSTTETTP
jgi:hypothetical protein